MIVFWVAASALAAAAAGLVLFRAAAASQPAVDPTSAVYRRQLAEIDELAQRGLIAEDERRSAHAEAGRRLLRAAEAGPETWRTGGTVPLGILAAAGVAAAATLGLYVLVGHPGSADQPFARRLAEWRASDPASLQAPELAAVLERLTQERPDDAEAFRFLAVARGASQDPAGALRAVKRAVQLAPRRADLWELLGQAEIAIGDGAVTPQAEAAFREAARLDPSAFAARFHLARAQIDLGDKAGGVAAWQALLADMPADDPRRGSLVQAIAEAQGQASSRPSPAEGQLGMIRGMVQRLAARLAASPDDPQGWVRLVRAYAVLGDAPRRDAALASAKARFAGRPDVTAELDAAARAEPMR